MKPRVLIVEDEPGIADTLQYALRTEGFEPTWCATGEAALKAVTDAEHAIVILDVGLPDASGFEVFKQIRATSEVPVVFLTARTDEIDRVVGLELGADDYVAKPFSPRELVARVRSILRRTARAPATSPAPAAASPSPAPSTAALPAAAAPAGPIDIDPGRMRVRYYGRVLDLSRYEFGLVCALASRPGHVFSRESLLARVWGSDTESMDRTVDAHVKTLRAKMKTVAPDIEPIRTHRGSGYALADDLPAQEDTMTATRRRFCLGLVPLTLGLAVPAARAADARYAVLSLIGDEMVVVNRRMQTGSRIASNDRISIPVDNASLDDAAFFAADASVARVDGAADRLRFSIRDPRLYALQERLVVGDDRDAAAMRAELRRVCADARVTRLLLVTKRRSDAAFALRDGTIGDGKVAGAGFYLDQQFETTLTATGERATGFIAPYASVAVWLVDVANWRVLASDFGVAHRLATPAGSADAVSPWDALTPKAKGELLGRVVEEATGGAVDRLLASAATR